MFRSTLPAAAICIALTAGTAPAQQAGTIVDGEAPVGVEGSAAATAGDRTSTGNVVTGGSSNVFIGGKPAALAGSGTDCGGSVVSGSASVFVNGRPLATAGSAVSPCSQD